MTYRSTAFVPELEGHWTIEGELTIREITLPMPLSVQISGIIFDSRGNIRVDIHTCAQANRKDFGLLADLDQETGGMTVGKDVVITVDTEIFLPK
jgi:polyisoprenoid-binding protein YceI